MKNVQSIIIIQCLQFKLWFKISITGSHKVKAFLYECFSSGHMIIPDRCRNYKKHKKKGNNKTNAINHQRSALRLLRNATSKSLKATAKEQSPTEQFCCHLFSTKSAHIQNYWINSKQRGRTVSRRRSFSNVRFQSPLLVFDCVFFNCKSHPEDLCLFQVVAQ